MSTTDSELKELQAIWDTAIKNVTFKNKETIPEYNLSHLTECSKSIEATPKLRSVFESLLQSYLNNNAKYQSMNVLVLLDIAITISLSASRSSSSTVDDKLYFFVFNLLETFCEYLSCDKLEIIVFYLTKRTKILCQLSKEWELKFKTNKKSINNLELPILKFCNKVLFRLNNIAKRGEFLVFMSNFVDIDSRSGQNFLGHFDLANITKTDEDEATAHKLYRALWGIQEIFNDPRWIGKVSNNLRFTQFRNDLDLVLKCFKNNVIHMDEAVGHFKTVHNGNKNAYSHCKYLTSLRLFDKQLNNPSFRRYILVQSLILLSSHRIDVPSEHPKLTPFKQFAAEQKEWIQAKYVEIMKNVLPSIPPNGETFTKFIQNILQRDENWLVWKYNKKDSRCNKLKREWKNKEAPPPKRRKINKKAHASAIAMGNNNLRDIFLWTPDVFQSKRNDVELHQNGEALQFLNDYPLIDFKNKLNQRLDYLLEQHQATKNRKNRELMLSNEKTVFSNLRIMRDLNHDMFAEICPMANNPEPKTFKCRFLFDALKHHSPKTFANQSNGYHHSRKYSRAKTTKR